MVLRQNIITVVTVFSSACCMLFFSSRHEREEVAKTAHLPSTSGIIHHPKSDQEKWFLL